MIKTQTRDGVLQTNIIYSNVDYGVPITWRSLIILREVSNTLRVNSIFRGINIILKYFITLHPIAFRSYLVCFFSFYFSSSNPYTLHHKSLL